jgi:hypothetical protein
MGFMKRLPFRASAAQPAAANLAADKTAETATEDGRTSPEPLSLVLPAIAALGAVASIAAVAWIAQDREGNRPRVKRRIDVILRDLETSCIGLVEILKRVRRHARQLGLDGSAGGSAIKFGMNGGRVDAAGGAVYKALVNDLATMLVLATQNSYDAINAIEDGEIDAPEDVFVGFGEAQERLNQLLIQRASVRAAIDHSIDIGQQLAGLVGQLKQFKTAPQANATV